MRSWPPESNWESRMLGNLHVRFGVGAGVQFTAYTAPNGRKKGQNDLLDRSDPDNLWSRGRGESGTSLAIDRALRRGSRGLPGRSSLAALLTENRGYQGKVWKRVSGTASARPCIPAEPTGGETAGDAKTITLSLRESIFLWLFCRMSLLTITTNCST